MKKISALLMAVIILMIALMPSASAVTVNGNGIDPGNTRWSNPDYNYAWLDNLFIRDDASSVTLKEIVPKPDDYPYSHTFEDFMSECNNWAALYEIDENTVSETYYQLVDAMYYAVVVMGMTADTDSMVDYLTSYGILMPEKISNSDIAALSIVYAALKNNAAYILYGEEIIVPVGTSLEGALVIILAGITGTYLPSGINTVTGFAVQAVKNYVTEFEALPLSSNPDVAEIFYWVKVLVVSENGYQVPTDNYAKVADIQKEYVNYAYRSVLLELAFDVQINPVLLMAAAVSEEENATERLVLETMLDTSGVSYAEGASLQELFTMACENGWFALENEFYSDVLNYEMEVAPSCEKIWFTPITLGDQLDDGDAGSIRMILQGKEIALGSTNAVALDTQAQQETITLSVVYNDGSVDDNAIYTFTVTKNPTLEKETTATDENDVVGQIQDYINSMVPTDNETVSSIFSNINDAAESIEVNNGSSELDSLLTTYGTDTSSETTSSSYDFEYFEKLINDIYTTDENGNIVTTSVYVASEETTTQKTVIETAVEAVTENIEFVVAPTGLIALGGLVGFFFNRKHRDSELFSDENHDDPENE